MIFNVSIDDIEQTETDLLSETFENEINIGEFFDETDREFFRQNELLSVNESSDLIPAINLPGSPNGSELVTSFEQNGLPSEPMSSPSSILSDICIFATSTPIRDLPVDN